MTLRNACMSATIAIALISFGVAPAYAQHRGGGNGGNGGNGGHGGNGGNGGNRGNGGGARSAPRTTAPRGFSGNRGFGGGQRSFLAPRSYAAPRSFSGNRSFASPRGFGGGYRYGSHGFSSRVIGPRVIIGSPFRAFSRPYYSFRPRYSLGFGLFIGYPVEFPYYGYYGYDDVYGYPYAGAPYPYPYPDSVVTYPGVSSAAPYPRTVQPYPAAPPSNNGALNPGQENFGGASFAITPNDAQVYVDGQYVGVVGSFSPTSQPLTLTPGRHRVEIRAPGYQTMTSDVDVEAGQVVPFQGTMQR